jgi:hypothetical protein
MQKWRVKKNLGPAPLVRKNQRSSAKRRALEVRGAFGSFDMSNIFHPRQTYGPIGQRDKSHGLF